MVVASSMVLIGAAAVVTLPAAQAATITPGAWYNIINVHSGKAIEVSGGSTADAATVVQQTVGSGQNQQFRFESAGTGWWRIVARHSGKAIDLWEWNTAGGAEFRQWPITSGVNQQFSVQNIGDNIQLINRHSGLALEVWEWSTANGARISQFDDLDGANQQWRIVQVGSGGGPTTPPPTGNPPSTSFPTPTGNSPVNNGTIQVSGTFDGGMRRYCCIGDGGQGESQDPVFEIAAGGTLQNVILGAPAGDGVHCEGNCTLRNVWWEDVGEDAATFRGGSNYYVIGGGARSASDKVFQHNGSGTVHINGFYAENVGKLYRACGNCSSSYQRHVVMDNVTVRSTKVLAGINTNWGDTARFTRITVYGSAVICEKYRGVSSGNEPEKIGEGADGVNCFYSSSDITIR
ncbi:pectate lyase [Plantactinospora soyae]|uniref:pectate lyase n=1 Tax=Plantactinospora soyae TaxID=1544732 RepID=A0A927MC25_9ACTN|nr:pectate lyase [Plantactinospora soyae]MBE1491719.1 hypothetical protein [Plantactinospora soyae]